MVHTYLFNKHWYRMEWYFKIVGALSDSLSLSLVKNMKY